MSTTPPPTPTPANALKGGDRLDTGLEVYDAVPLVGGATVELTVIDKAMKLATGQMRTFTVPADQIFGRVN